ncbi:MAG: hypothetical protein E6J28_05945 [Chloroflexi bacterium]|nr:MAG: hypothetical protein E6J28_05945 [Chloroflexota bacterium]
MLDLQVGDQAVVRLRDLLGAHEPVQQLVHAAGRQHELDVVDGAVRVQVAEALIQQLVAYGRPRLQADHRGLAEADLAAQLVDRLLRLLNQRLLGGDLPVEAPDHGVDGVDLGDGVLDLMLDGVELVLVVHLLTDPLVVGETCLVHGRRVPGIAVDRGDVLRRLRKPCQGGDEGGKGEAPFHPAQILT